MNVVAGHGGSAHRQDIGLEGSDAVVDAAAELAIGEQPEPAFDLVQPRRAGRGEVQIVPGMGGQLGADRGGLVGQQVVADQVDVQPGRNLSTWLGHVVERIVECSSCCWGRLIQVVPGRLGGRGGWLTNRSGWFVWATLRVSARVKYRV